jgi:hypothetical protein
MVDLVLQDTRLSAGRLDVHRPAFMVGRIDGDSRRAWSYRPEAGRLKQLAKTKNLGSRKDVGCGFTLIPLTINLRSKADSQCDEFRRVLRTLGTARRRTHHFLASPRALRYAGANSTILHFSEVNHAD